MKKILIITYSQDNECIKMVTDAAEELGAKAYRFDTDRFPTDMKLTLEETNKGRRWIFGSEQGELDLSELDGVWYRRLRIGDKLPKMDPELRRPSVMESQTMMYGFLEGLDTFVMDRYHVVRCASHKQLQLNVAREVGLEIPETIVTNNPDEVRQFFPKCKHGMITKMMSSFAIYEDNKEKVVFTNMVKEDDLKDLDGLHLCPMTFQENIPKKLELRVTVVGNNVFAAAIDSQKSEKATDDWRKDGLGLVKKWEPYTLPKEIETKLLKLMDKFKLNYGAVDFIVTPENKHIFLEINPGGEFFWLELYNPKFPISKAIAKLVLGESFRR